MLNKHGYTLTNVLVVMVMCSMFAGIISKYANAQLKLMEQMKYDDKANMVLIEKYDDYKTSFDTNYTYVPDVSVNEISGTFKLSDTKNKKLYFGSKVEFKKAYFKFMGTQNTYNNNSTINMNNEKAHSNFKIVGAVDGLILNYNDFDGYIFDKGIIVNYNGNKYMSLVATREKPRTDVTVPKWVKLTPENKLTLVKPRKDNKIYTETYLYADKYRDTPGSYSPMITGNYYVVPVNENGTIPQNPKTETVDRVVYKYNGENSKEDQAIGYKTFPKNINEEAIWILENNNDTFYLDNYYVNGEMIWFRGQNYIAQRNFRTSNSGKPGAINDSNFYEKLFIDNEDDPFDYFILYDEFNVGEVDTSKQIISYYNISTPEAQKASIEALEKNFTNFIKDNSKEWFTIMFIKDEQWFTINYRSITKRKNDLKIKAHNVNRTFFIDNSQIIDAQTKLLDVLKELDPTMIQLFARLIIEDQIINGLTWEHKSEDIKADPITQVKIPLIDIPNIEKKHIKKIREEFIYNRAYSKDPENAEQYYNEDYMLIQIEVPGIFCNQDLAKGILHFKLYKDLRYEIVEKLNLIEIETDIVKSMGEFKNAIQDENYTFQGFIFDTNLKC